MQSRVPIAGPEWTKIDLGGFYGLLRKLPSGLTVTLGDELLPAAPGGLLPGWWRHMVISREDRHPSWEEMRDFIRSCGMFDSNREVVMLLPPAVQYVNIHAHAFHWFQLLAERTT